MDSTQTVSPIQRDAFKDLVTQYTTEIIHTQTFADLFRTAMLDTMDSLADRLADRCVEALSDTVDVEEVVRNSDALRELESKLEDVVQNAVDNINF